MSRSKKPARVDAGPGQESVWDYPRQPRLELTRRRLRVVLGGVTVADTTRGSRILETSHPPNYYFPAADIRSGALEPEAGSSWCEWKGQAQYYTVRVGDRVEQRAAWSYAHPNPRYGALAGMVAFYPAPMDACFVDEELVRAQPGGFYGGWITTDVVGPFRERLVRTGGERRIHPFAPALRRLGDPSIWTLRRSQCRPSSRVRLQAVRRC